MSIFCRFYQNFLNFLFSDVGGLHHLRLEDLFDFVTEVVSNRDRDKPEPKQNRKRKREASESVETSGCRNKLPRAHEETEVSSAPKKSFAGNDPKPEGNPKNSDHHHDVISGKAVDLNSAGPSSDATTPKA